MSDFDRNAFGMDYEDTIRQTIEDQAKEDEEKEKEEKEDNK